MLLPCLQHLHHILGNYECFEPVMSNIYSQRVLAGEYTVINNNLIYDLMYYGIWNEDLKNKIITHDGSVQNINEIPNLLKYDIKQHGKLNKKILLICLLAEVNIYVNHNH